MSPSAIRRSTWYSKSGKAVSQAESACLHFSRLVFFSSLSDMPGATISSITARFPLFQSSSKYLRIAVLFCSADMAHPFVRMHSVICSRPNLHAPVHDRLRDSQVQGASVPLYLGSLLEILVRRASGTAWPWQYPRPENKTR